MLHCLQYGTQMGWLIDPEEQTVFVYRPKQEPRVLDQLNTVIPVPEFASELKLTIQDLFDRLSNCF
ncbi:MAG: Uma2 family endonuclease [Halothece sp. Uz-M2-17]|nr:Uma2 family endonuclease [Halothece sp. Uz-M2-17]